MDKIRQGEIALLLLKQHARDEGIRFKKDFQRGVHNVAKSIGIKKEEAMEFAEIIIREIVDEAFAPKADAK